MVNYLYSIVFFKLGSDKQNKKDRICSYRQISYIHTLITNNQLIVVKQDQVYEFTRIIIAQNFVARLVVCIFFIFQSILNSSQWSRSFTLLESVSKITSQSL